MTVSRIPKIIYQTWETRDLDPKMHAAMQSWIDLNPEYRHELFDAGDRRAFVKAHFPARVLNAYDRLVPGTYQADFWRFCILHVTGGINVDIDCVCMLPISTAIAPTDEFVSGKAPSHPFAIWVGFVASRPGHPFLKASLEQVIRNIETDYYGRSGVWPTGPVAAGFAVNRYGNCRIRRPYALGWNERGGQTFKLLSFERATKEVRNEAGDVVMLTKYDGYLAYRRKAVVPYSQSWLEGAIYHYDKPSRLRRMRHLLRLVSTVQGRRYLRKRAVARWRRFAG